MWKSPSTASKPKAGASQGIVPWMQVMLPLAWWPTRVMLHEDIPATHFTHYDALHLSLALWYVRRLDDPREGRTGLTRAWLLSPGPGLLDSVALGQRRHICQDNL